MNVKVKKNEEKAESTEILAEAIVSIGKAMENLDRSGLNRKAIVVLIKAETKISERDINKILNALNQLKVWYCKK